MSSSIPERIGRYEVIERLGIGGMGVVYLATDPLLSRTVAVKVLPGEHEDLRERFAREARSAASLRHPNIVTIYDVGEDNGQPYIAMEFLDGESMAELIRRRAPLPLARRLRLIIELCAGLGYAHRSGIIHRDIKPANLMITSEEGLKILDFGLARLVAETTAAGLTQVGTLLGTPHYWSPEQITGKTVDQKSDIFAVGLVLYELLSYQKAFPGDAAPMIIHDILAKEPTPIRQLLPDIDEELEGVVTRAIDKDRDRRYPNLGVLADALENIRRRTAGPGEDTAWSRRLRRQTGAGTWIGTTAGAASDESAQRLDAIGQKRAAQIAQHLVAAEDRLQKNDVDAALEHCEQALMLDPEDERALDTLRRAHRAKDDAQVQGWIEEARAQLARGAVTEAVALIDQSLRVRANQPEALLLQKDLREQRRERERKAERQRSAQAAMERAKRNMENGALDAALRCASEALANDPDHAEAGEFRARVVAMAEERHRAQQHDQAARDMVAKARDISQQDPDTALALLRTFTPPHALVTGLIADLESRVAAREDKRKAEEGRARAERAATEPAKVDAGELPPPAASESPPTGERLPAADWTAGPGAAVPPQPRTIPRNAYLLVVVAAAVLLALGGAALLLSSRPGPTPGSADAQASKPTDSTGQPTPENAERYRRFLAQADERLAARDPEGAMAAIQEAEKILAGDGRVEALKKQVESVRAAVRQSEQQRAEIERALDESAKMTNDNEAIARLQRELEEYPGNAAITNAIGERTKARDTRIADLVRSARPAPDAQAVTLLQEAFTLDRSRLDVRRELERRRASLLAAGKAPPRTRAEVEEDVRRTLYAYQAAYASRSVDDFLKIARFRTRAQIENEFKSFRSIQLNIEGINISLDESATHAVINCTISSVRVPADPGSDRSVTEKRTWQFQLANIGGVWQVTSANSR